MKTLLDVMRKGRMKRRYESKYVPGDDAMWRMKDGSNVGEKKNKGIVGNPDELAKKHKENSSRNKSSESKDKPKTESKPEAKKEQEPRKQQDELRANPKEEKVANPKKELVSRKTPEMPANPDDVVKTIGKPKASSIMDKMRSKPKDAAPKEQPKEEPKPEAKAPEKPVEQPKAAQGKEGRISPAEASALITEAAQDGRFASWVRNAIRKEQAKNPGKRIDIDPIESAAMEGIMKAAASMRPEEMGDPNIFKAKALTAIQTAILDNYKKEGAVKRGKDASKQMGEEFDAADKKTAAPDEDKIDKEKVNKFVDSLGDPLLQDIAKGIMGGKSVRHIAREVGMSHKVVGRLWKEISEEAKSQGDDKFYNQYFGDKERYGKSPIRDDVWEEIIKQSKQYPFPGEFVRCVMEAMEESQGQWDAINIGRKAYLSGDRYEKLEGGKGDKKLDSDFDPDELAKGVKVESEHTNDKEVKKEIAKDHLTEDDEYYDKLEKIEKPSHAPRHQAPKRLDGAVARLEALLEYRDEIDEEALEDEVRGIAREFDASDLKEIARKFGVKRGLATKLVALEKILAKVCGDKDD
jgi:hypothetical protein